MGAISQVHARARFMKLVYSTHVLVVCVSPRTSCICSSQQINVNPSFTVTKLVVVLAVGFLGGGVV